MRRNRRRYPLAPVERTVIGSGGAGDCFTAATHRSYTWGCGVHVWATHATVSGATFYAAFPFLAGKASPSTQNVTLYRADLEYLVDGANPDGDFAAVPRGTFADATLPADSYVVWRSNWLDSQNASDPCAGATGLRAASKTDDVFFDGVEVTANRDDYVLVNAAPLLGTAALLGEAGKVAAVSTYRFASIASDDAKITVGLRGDAGERVTLLFAWHASEAPDFACAAVSATIGADGTGTASFSA